MNNTTNRMRKALFVGLLAGFCTSVQAELLPRLGGQAQYDTELDITWLTDANASAGYYCEATNQTYTDGRMPWDCANTWAGELNGSLAYAVLFILLWLWVLWVLYRKRIFFRV